jgi:predicted CXXCH cytochrome family protein
MTHLIIKILVFLMAPLPLSSVFFDSGQLIYQESCMDCHSDMVDKDVRHAAIENGCDICHESTGEAHPEDGKKGFVLVDQTPALCYYCHEESEAANFVHQPLVQGECLSCHDVHASSNPALMKLPDPDMCLSCHPIVQGKVILHSAIESGGCTMCHLPHGAQFKGLLTEKFPDEEYVPAKSENFSLCFMCHDTDLLEAERTDWATNFRNGDRNLHYVHIRGEKGRSCKMCHNLHASKQKSLIEESIRFGNWEMQMNFTNNEHGGSCLPGCHGKKTYRQQGLVSQ